MSNLASSSCSSSEQLIIFEQTFASRCALVEQHISEAIQTSDLNPIHQEITTLHQLLTDTKTLLKNYHIEKYQHILFELTRKVQEIEARLVPKKKFGFKNRSAVKNPCKDDDVAATEIDSSVRRHSVSVPIVSEQSFGLCNRRGEHFELIASEINGRDIVADNLENCTVKIYGNPSTLQLNQLRNCQVLTGPVTTSILANECHDSTLVIACQQLRLHAATNLVIYLHVSCKAILEDCQAIRVAPYNWQYAQLEEDFVAAGLDRTKNHWNQLEDFNWLKFNEASPNWSLLDAANTVTSWNA